MTLGDFFVTCSTREKTNGGLIEEIGKDLGHAYKTVAYSTNFTKLFLGVPATLEKDTLGEKPFHFHHFPFIFQSPSDLPSLSNAMALQLIALSPIVLISSYLPFASPSNFSYPAIFNFGDSNSDTGGLVAGIAFPLGPPNGQTFFLKPSGRFCDGRLTIDFLSNVFLPFDLVIMLSRSFPVQKFVLFTVCKLELDSDGRVRFKHFSSIMQKIMI